MLVNPNLNSKPLLKLCLLISSNQIIEQIVQCRVVNSHVTEEGVVAPVSSAKTEPQFISELWPSPPIFLANSKWGRGIII